MPTALAKKYPVFLVGSGPTNSMRGACALANIQNAIVIDVGGTTTDIGILNNGFPRQSHIAVEVGGVRTNFRMPDLISVGLGGGTIIRRHHSSIKIGPQSVGYEVITQALACKGDVLTLSDISVINGKLLNFGDKSLLTTIDKDTINYVNTWVNTQLNIIIDKIKTNNKKIPLIIVGGGAHLVPQNIEGVSVIIKPDFYAVANAYGAAIAEVSGQIEKIYMYDIETREKALIEAKELAIANALSAGADPNKIEIKIIEEIPLSYVKGGACRVFVKASGPLV